MVDPRQRERSGGHVDVLDQVVADDALGDARSAHDERNVCALVVEKLLAAGVADAVIGHEEHDGVVEQLLPLQPRDHIAHFLVRVPAAVEVVGPVLEDHRIARVVRREHDVGGIGVRAEFLFHAVLPGRVRPLPAVLAAVQLDLHEERLARLASGPVVAVVHLAVPLEVVVGLAEPVAGRLESADARVVAGLLEQHGNRHDVPGKLDLQFAATAAVVMGADRGLITPGDQCRPA